MGFEIEEEASGVSGGGRGADADAGHEAIDGRAIEDDLGGVAALGELAAFVTDPRTALLEDFLFEGEIKEATNEKKKKFPTGIPECGTDALRFGLLSYMIQSSINLDVQRVVGYRQFCNKLWNIVKFAMTNFPEDFVPEEQGPDTPGMKLALADKWILTRLSKAVDNTN